MKKKLIALIVILTFLLGTAGYKLYSKKEEGITATGTIEVTKIDIMPKISGYLSQLNIQEGDVVKTGETIACLARPDLEAQLLRDEAALDKAQAQLRDLERGSRVQERQEAAANLIGVDAVYRKAKADYERYNQLYKQGAVSAQQLDAAQSAYQVAASSLQAAQSRQSLVEEGTRPEAIAAQRMEVKRNQAILESSRTMVADTIVTSPLSGLVVSKNFENGEYVTPGAPLATVANFQDCWVKIYVASTQLGQIKVGQQAVVRVDSFPGQDFKGIIKEISQNAEFTPRQSITEKERANLVFAVKVKIENPDGVLKPGMPADVVLK